jgi:hypothetical protein
MLDKGSADEFLTPVAFGDDSRASPQTYQPGRATSLPFSRPRATAADTLDGTLKPNMTYHRSIRYGPSASRARLGVLCAPIGLGDSTWQIPPRAAELIFVYNFGGVSGLLSISRAMQSALTRQTDNACSNLGGGIRCERGFLSLRVFLSQG